MQLLIYNNRIISFPLRLAFDTHSQIHNFIPSYIPFLLSIILSVFLSPSPMKLFSIFRQPLILQMTVMLKQTPFPLLVRANMMMIQSQILKSQQHLVASRVRVMMKKRMKSLMVTLKSSPMNSSRILKLKTMSLLMVVMTMMMAILLISHLLNVNAKMNNPVHSYRLSLNYELERRGVVMGSIQPFH